MQVFANLTYTVTRYVLFQAGQEEHIYTGSGLTEEIDNKSCKSFISGIGGKSVKSANMTKTPNRMNNRRTTPMVSATKMPIHN